jgi:hypothetical protein
VCRYPLLFFVIVAAAVVLVVVYVGAVVVDAVACLFSCYLCICGSTALCWALAVFSVS